MPFKGCRTRTLQTRDTMDNLVKRLSEGSHPVRISLRPEATVEAFREAIDRDYVHVLFTETRGGTELGFSLDSGSDLSDADFDAEAGSVHLEGELELNFVPVRCIADIDLSTLKGEGHLEVLEEEMKDDPEATATAP